MVNPWGVEPQSKEPESFILSIELRVQVTFLGKCGCKITAISVTLQHLEAFWVIYGPRCRQVNYLTLLKPNAL